jgi:hypothetical protein
MNHWHWHSQRKAWIILFFLGAIAAILLAVLLPLCDHSSTTVVLPQLHQETVVLERYVNHLLGEVTQTKDRRSKNLTRTRNVPPKCNKQVTSKQQTRSFLTSIN